MTLSLAFVALLPTIWIVDASNGPGTNFTDLPPAIAAAAPGDTILVRSGTYSVFTVNWKALTIRGAGAATTVVSSSPPPSTYADYQTTIDGIQPGATFYMSGLAFASPQLALPVGNPSLRVLGPTTNVVLADVTVAGTSQVGPGRPGLAVFGGATVHAARCIFTGGAGNGSGGSGGAGAVVDSGSVLAADAATFTGGPGSPFASSMGGAGLSVLAGTATLARSSAFGGACPVNGGHGLAVSQSGFARVAGTSASIFRGGTGSGPTAGGYAAWAEIGSSIIVHGGVSLQAAVPGGGITSGAVTTGAVTLPYLSVTGSTTAAGEVLAAQPVLVTFDGAIPFAPIACVIDVAPGFSTNFAPLLLGELLVPLPTGNFFQSTLDALGMLQGTITPAVSAPSLTGIPIYAQFGVFDAAAGQIRLSNGHIRIFN